jgi:hypothetical protein
VVRNLLTTGVLVLVGSRLVAGLRVSMRPAVRERVLEIVRGVRPRHALLAPVVLVLVLAAAVALMSVPGLDWGWWQLLGGEGNPVLGVTDETAGNPLEWIVPAVFLALLVPALPLFAEREERMFRAGAEHWSAARRVGRGVVFGLVHALIGIPVGAALALSIGGWYFTAVYLWGHRRSGGDPEAALLESIRAHAVYNAEVVVLVALALIGGV